jgi:hypothetical protein
LNFPEGTLFNRVNADRFKYKEKSAVISVNLWLRIKEGVNNGF